jgi:hypothetical protein
VDFDDLDALRRHHPAWRLLRADSAALILGFLGQVFVEENVRAIAASELTRRLDEVLYALNDRLGEGTFPRPASAYLTDWASPESGWLRKYYPAGQNEPFFDATPDVERAYAWVGALRARDFVGTESRLSTVLDLLRQIVHGSERDPQRRLAELHRRRAELDTQIARVEAGDVPVLDPTAVRDRYQQLSDTSRALLADFREVEANFRSLDRDLRQRVAAWSGSKAELLDDVLGSRSSISDSDQGRSFHAFYDFLLSPSRQEEFRSLLAQAHALEVIGEPDPRMRHIHHDWLGAGERTQSTVRLLSEELRRFLDDQVWLENRRVVDLLRSIESTALAIRDRPPKGLLAELDATAPRVALPFERPLYSAPRPMTVTSDDVDEGDDELDASLLFDQVFVDRARLGETVRRALQGRDQVDLGEVLTVAPVEHGLAEVVTYLALDDESFDVVFDDTVRSHLTWHDPDGAPRTVTLPGVTYVRTGRPPARSVAPASTPELPEEMRP